MEHGVRILHLPTANQHVREKSHNPGFT